jgi:hypothetical protein
MGLSPSTVSRHFIEASAKELAAFRERDLSGYDLVAMVRGTLKRCVKRESGVTFQEPEETSPIGAEGKEDTAVEKKIIEGADGSSVVWDELEEWVRGQIQNKIQDILEEEVATFLGRRKSERRCAVDAAPGYRNGYGKPRRLTLSGGTITVRRLRIRNLEERFESRILPLFARRTKGVSDLLPELYLHGLSEGDFDLALRGLLGDGAPLSPSSIARLKSKWQGEYEEWAHRSLEDLEEEVELPMNCGHLVKHG